MIKVPQFKKKVSPRREAFFPLLLFLFPVDAADKQTFESNARFAALGFAGRFFQWCLFIFFTVFCLSSSCGNLNGKAPGEKHFPHIII